MINNLIQRLVDTVCSFSDTLVKRCKGIYSNRREILESVLWSERIEMASGRDTEDSHEDESVESVWSQLNTSKLSAIVSRESPLETQRSPSHVSCSESLNEGAVDINPVLLCPHDPCSFSRPDQIAVVHMDIFWNVNFRRSKFEGEVSLHLSRKLKTVNVLSLDTWKLDIKSVKLVKENVNLQYMIHPHMGVYGSKMDIHLPPYSSEKDVVHIVYDTHECARALQWVYPEHTEGKKFPFIFSQCECIRCRSIIPCQDTPCAKFTFTAKVTAPIDLTVLMSGIKKGKMFLLPKGRKLHSFEQDTPIPTYLIAIAIGEFEFCKLGPRSRVWSEPPLIERASSEFQATEVMLEAAESICGPYEWGTYHLLVMPYAFPFLAMENPGITFISRNVLAGDQSLVHVLAHEIAHSWIGNLVTNSNFEHFWLNEGVCTFIERKILGNVLGWEFRLFFASRGLKKLRDVIRVKGSTNPHTKLVMDMKNSNPDSMVSIIPYEKGHTLMYYLESLVGNSHEFDNFIKKYIQTFKVSSIDSELFKEYFCDYFNMIDAIQLVDWDTWFYSPGMPPVIPNYRTRLEEECVILRNKWSFWNGGSPIPFSKTDIENLCPVQVQEFLDQMLMLNLPQFKLKTMEHVYRFHESSNMDTRYKWILLCIQNRMREIIPSALQFVQQVGRLSYIITIYRALNEWDEARERAGCLFRDSHKSMARRTARLIAKELGTSIDDS